MTRRARATARRAGPRAPGAGEGRVVVKAKMQKTRVVAVERPVRHDVLPQTIAAPHLHGTTTRALSRGQGPSWGPGPVHKRRWRVEEILSRHRGSRTPPRDPGLGEGRDQMRTILDVADNSGPARFHDPAPRRVHGLRGPGRLITANEGVGPCARSRAQGSGEGGHRALRQGAAALRRSPGLQFRQERGRAINEGASCRAPASRPVARELRDKFMRHPSPGGPGSHGRGHPEPCGSTCAKRHRPGPRDVGAGSRARSQRSCGRRTGHRAGWAT
jgi:hypothetical protein